MEHIWAPWRMEYIRMEKSAGCVLCEKVGENVDEANYILHRAGLNFVVLNTYPYNPGHLLVAPYRHLASLEDLTVDELHEHFELVRRCVWMLREALNPGGFNIGTNIGKAAGAGIADHVHTHVVPRWQGDVNFMPVLAETRVIPEGLAETYRQLKDRL